MTRQKKYSCTNNDAKTDRFSRMKRTLAEGLAVLSFAGMAACAGPNGSSHMSHAKPAFLAPGKSYESEVIVEPVNVEGNIIRISVLVFEPLVDKEGTGIKEYMQEIVHKCYADPGCIMEKAQETAAGQEFRMAYLPDARVTVKYYNSIAGEYDSVPGCRMLYADESTAVAVPSAKGTEEIPQFYAECDVGVTRELERGRVMIKIIFKPESGSGISKSEGLYLLENRR